MIASPDYILEENKSTSLETDFEVFFMVIEYTWNRLPIIAYFQEC